ncbi:hypothetical protein OIDMADRAFT_204152 [Oidiodendron maius Zn]|uniref:Tetraspanin n=1 Tax=Oidiodendron maius (strain Zn) TaxID=913774 RepID=A0A0C3H4L2_OIDMZ|nr:hypothetical protein OIDMADRAFT_204152 [Oidiodendron maius Zn]
MKDKVLLTYAAMNILFLVSGVLLLIFALTTKSNIGSTPNLNTIARNLVLGETPGTATIANAGVVFFTFLISIPAMVLPMTRGWLKIHGYMIVFCAGFTLVLGLIVWFETLTSRARLGNIWNALSDSTQSLVQQELHCCGYLNSTSPQFVTDAQCPTDLSAASQVGCVGPFSTYANNFLDLVFTGAFGIVGLDVALLLATTMLSKARREKERYRVIDQKNGVGAI